MTESMIDRTLAWAETKLGDPSYAGRCLGFVEDCFERGNSIEVFGYRSAQEAADAYGAQPGGQPAPRGALVFYACQGLVGGDLNEVLGPRGHRAGRRARAARVGCGADRPRARHRAAGSAAHVDQPGLHRLGARRAPAGGLRAAPVGPAMSQDVAAALTGCCCPRAGGCATSSIPLVISASTAYPRTGVPARCSSAPWPAAARAPSRPWRWRYRPCTSSCFHGCSRHCHHSANVQYKR